MQRTRDHTDHRATVQRINGRLLIDLLILILRGAALIAAAGLDRDCCARSRAGGGAAAAPARRAARGGEANLVLPDLSTETFQGINGRTLLMGGLVVCLLGLGFGMVDLHAAEEHAGAPLDAARSPS